MDAGLDRASMNGVAVERGIGAPREEPCIESIPSKNSRSDNETGIDRRDRA